MRFTVVTILPELIEPALSAGVVGRARTAGVIDVTTVNPRDFVHDRHRTVDDTPYGGGPGMVMKPEPLVAAIRAAGPAHRILLSPAGRVLTHARARELARLPHVVLVCGRYEGVDERVVDLAIDEQVSIGDYVLSGGELGALVVIDACARFVPGVLGEASSTEDESHAGGLVEYPQYTRPAELEGLAVPAILASGNHAAIAAWRRGQALQRTATRRPDLWRRYRLAPGDDEQVSLLPARTHIALVHYPVVDRTGAIVTTALTNFDIHDIARSARTYGLAGYHVVTPVQVQREKADHIVAAWAAEEHGDHRVRALSLVRSQPSIEAAIDAIETEHGMSPLVVATSARGDAFPNAAHVTCDELLAAAYTTEAPVLLVFGTGWGLADTMIPSVSRVLAPIEGVSDWNHLSVRSAAAVILDRLLGRIA